MSSEAPVEGEEFTATAAIDGYIVLGICFGMPAVLAALVMFFRPELFREWLPVLAIGFFGVTLIFAWLSAFRLQVRDGELIYRTLLAGENRVPLNDVTAVQRVLEFNPWTHWGRPRNRLEIFTSRDSDIPVLYINLKVFTKRDVGLFLRLLDPKRLGHHQ